MVALIPIILDILLKLIGYFFKKAEEREFAEKQLFKIFKSLDDANAKASTMRRKYSDARNRMNHSK